ncbi:MAG: hypothetical protein VXY83_02910 [Pseudomonadota bacterium]|nr:hypothetical protein [Pseudomonadota bacterium]
MRENRYESMILNATSLPQEASLLESFLRWFSPAFASVFLLIALMNVEPHVIEEDNIASNITVTHLSDEGEEAVGMVPFDTADDYLMLTSIEF